MSLLKGSRYGKVENLVIVGAGEAGELIAKYIFEHGELNYNIYCFIDDDPRKIGTSLLGVPVLGTINKIGVILKDKDINKIIIAIPSAEGGLIREIFKHCFKLQIQVDILPSSFKVLAELEKGQAGFSDIRSLEIEDFFKRKPVIANLSQVKDSFENKVVMVTGGAGSIGSELCRQLMEFNIKKLVIIDQAESELHSLILELNKKDKDMFVPILASIRDKKKMDSVFKRYFPEIVFHAAAYKHVPMMELNPEEGVKTNIFGTKNIIDLAEEYSVRNFILISTDKAVNPSSVMGMTKRVTEMLIQGKNNDDASSIFTAVRFGNVLNSNGSVVPLFKKQIQEGGPLTVTHKDMDRYFMTIAEAVQLVIQSVVFGKNGNIFVLKMGEKLKILDIAEEMIRLNGFEPYRDIDIEFVGLRSGEKLTEELYSRKEDMVPTENSRISLVNTNSVDRQNLLRKIKTLSDDLMDNDSENVVTDLSKIVPKTKEKGDFLPYNLPLVDDDEIDELVDTVRGGWLTMGPKTVQFEKDLANYVGVKHAIAVNSCTAGLHLSLIVLGIAENDEVITSPFTFAATGNVIAHVGAKPVFVDIDEKTLNIDPEKIEAAITPRTKAIMVVHYGGQAADMDRIMEIANKYNLKVIEDAAHAIGCEYNGIKIGGHGNLTNFSFYATKNMTTGEGGAIVTNDDALADRLRILRLHGISKDAWKRYEKEGSWYYEIEECGWKCNMTDMQAALGLHQLKKLDGFVSRRREIASVFNSEFRNLLGVQLPFEKENRNHVYHLYHLVLSQYNRNEFINKLTKKGIGTSVHFIPLHLHPFYQREFGYKEGDFPVAERIYMGLVTLPLYPKMDAQDVAKVINMVKKILGESKKLSFRKANDSDCRFAYNWRMHPVARAVSRNQDEFSYDSHCGWFSKVLENPDMMLYFVLEGERRVGQIRFDTKGEDAVEISVSIDPELYGKGYGTQIVAEGSRFFLRTYSSIKTIIAEIKSDNVVSIKVFEKSGYRLINTKTTGTGDWRVYSLTKEDGS